MNRRLSSGKGSVSREGRNRGGRGKEEIKERGEKWRLIRKKDGRTDKGRQRKVECGWQG